ncbi:hypothetical protein AGMMS50239_10290 [Bacteroidia bacterium]|nr:hypothetical protein AGMMS50239_10290 [Bacteroidia bacterium]GHV32734.1 hypothetical protein FACS1894177_09040 [Bacteroidia bacterium]
MSEENFMDKYDDSDAVAFIRNYLPLELKEKVSDDDIYYILDVSEDFYEQSDFFETDDEAEERKLIEYIVKEAEKDEVGNFTREDILFILRGEEAYFESIYGDMDE